jgi:hypothetical protein
LGDFTPRYRRSAPSHTPPDSQLHVSISETPAHSQHGTASLQEYIPTLDRHHAGRVRDYAELMIGERNHAPHDAAG